MPIKPIDWKRYFRQFPRYCPVCGADRVAFEQEEMSVTQIGPVTVSYWECPLEDKHAEVVL